MPAAVMNAPRSATPEDFVRHHQGMVQRWLRALGCDGARAEEHCQDALLAALQHGLHAADHALAAQWLRTTARNLFWSQLRREHRAPPVLPLEGIEEAWLAARADEDGGDRALLALRACLEQADARDRQLLRDRYDQGLSRAQMAAQSGVEEGGIKKALWRIRSRLRSCMEGKLATEEGK